MSEHNMARIESRSSRPRNWEPVPPPVYSFVSFSVQHADWHERFCRALEHEGFRRADEGLRSLQAQAAKHSGADSATFRKMLVCLLEDTTFRVDLQCTLPRWHCIDLILYFDGKIRMVDGWKRKIGPATRQPREVISPAWRIARAINETKRWFLEQRRYLSRCMSVYEPGKDTIKPKKKDAKALTRLCLAVKYFTGRLPYNKVAGLVELASLAKGDREEWKADTIRKAVVRLWEQMDSDERDDLCWDLVNIGEHLLPAPEYKAWVARTFPPLAT